MIVPRGGLVIADRYALVRPLASGGMGSVWIARHRELEIDVTMKFMAAALVASADARTRFVREARVAARLRSQHVVQVLDYGVEDDTPYIVMELLEGESLWERVSREGPLPVPVVARLAVQICRALRTAHEAGLVHRDLKPGNVFLALKDDDEVVKILDFGIAKAAGCGDATMETDTGMILGSVHYMSPEQIRSSRDVDARSDLWSLGVILYRLLTGSLPFPGQVRGDVLVRVCTEPPPPLSSVAPDLPAWLDDFFDRALARDPALRFQSAMDLASAFSAMALGATSLPPSTPPPRWKATLLMGPPSGAVGAGGVANEVATQKLPEPPPPLTQPVLSSGADAPTLAVAPVSEVETAGSLQATLVRDAPVEKAHRTGPPIIDERLPVRPLWPLWALVAGVTLAGILVAAIRSRAPHPRLVATATATATALPVATEAAPVSVVTVDTTTSLDGVPSVASVAPSGSPRAPPPGVILKYDPYADVGKPKAPTQKPHGEVLNPGQADPPVTPRRASSSSPAVAPVVAPQPKSDPMDCRRD